MSRHLMARFRHLHAAEGLDWQHGTPLPHTKKWHDEAARDALRDPNRNPDHYDSSKHSVALTSHGEQRYGLEVFPHQPWKDSPPGWAWTIQQQNGPDISNPDHWGHSFHLQRDHGRASENPSGAVYSGGGDTREEAMAEAEHNFQKHVDHLNGQNPLKRSDYDINDIMNKFNGGEL